VAHVQRNDRRRPPGRTERPGSPLHGSEQRECAVDSRQHSQRRNAESRHHSFSGADGCHSYLLSLRCLLGDRQLPQVRIPSQSNSPTTLFTCLPPFIILKCGFSELLTHTHDRIAVLTHLSIKLLSTNS
jgi:hypothetical protein